MAVQSQFIVLRKIDIKFSQLPKKNSEEFDRIIKMYNDDEDARIARMEEYKREADEGKQPLIVPTKDDFIRKDTAPRFVHLGNGLFYDRDNGVLFIEVYSELYSSSFRDLSQRWNLNLDGRDSQHVVTVEEAKSINQITKYLVGGKYSNDVERYIDCSFIDVFKDMVPAYYSRNKKKGLCLYVEKQDGDSWKVTDSDYENSLYADQDEDDSFMVSNTAQVTDIFLKLYNGLYEWNGDSKDDVVLIYEMC